MSIERQTMPGLPVSFLLAVLVLGGCADKPQPLDPQLKHFVEVKRVQTTNLLIQSKAVMPPAGWAVFDSILANDWPSAQKQLARIDYWPMRETDSPLSRVRQATEIQLERVGLRQSSLSAVSTKAWHPLNEAYSAYAVTKHWQQRHLQLMSEAIIAAIPTNSIYFAGTDPGRFTVSAAIESRTHGRPFFVLSHNQLSDWAYLDYLNSMFGGVLNLPTVQDVSAALNAYDIGAQPRAAAGLLNKGETILATRSDGSFSVGGPYAVRTILTQLAKAVFDRNTNREFFIELGTLYEPEWVWPHLLPHGPILKINHEPVPRIPDDVMNADQEFWSSWCQQLLGNHVAPVTSVGDVCDFVERIYLHKDLSGFKGDADYLNDLYAQNWFGMQRHDFAVLFQRRCGSGTDPIEKQRMGEACLLAYEQAFILSPNACLDFASFLMQVSLTDEARRVLDLSARLNPEDKKIKQMLEKVKASPLEILK